MASSSDLTAVGIVGIGASAGGLEALEQMFGAMPTDSGLAFVIVQHLSRDYESMMDTLLSRCTTMSVRRVADGARPEPNTVYVMPPGKELIISSGCLLLTDSEVGNEVRLSIDVFFRSLAQDIGGGAIAVVLSGAGSDGSSGICEIHEAGGLVLCQSPDTAKFDSMPKNAMDTGIVDLALPPDQLPDAIQTYVRHEARSSQTTSPRETSIERILDMLHADHGVDFAHYKRAMVGRRIERRLAIRGVDDLEGYIRMLERSPQERDNLYRDLLIGVTRFFRDAVAFDMLERQVLPELVDQLPDDGELRVWVCGCGTGEEAYSLSMLIHEAFEAAGRETRARIFATDVHQRSLDQASLGVYSATSLEGVSDARQRRFFTHDGDSYTVGNDLRRSVVFARHDVIKDAPFTRLHLVSCRNLLIYLEPAAQKKALSLFLFGLQKSGVLLLGRSENASAFSQELDLIGEKARIYRKQRDVGLPAGQRLGFTRRVATSKKPEGSGRSLLKTYDELLRMYMPSALLVSQERELLHTFGGATEFLRVSEGRPSSDVLDIVAEELRGPITGILQRVRKTHAPVSLKRVRGVGDAEIDLEARPVLAQDERQAVLITIGTVDPVLPVEDSAELDARELSTERIRDLEEELEHTKESLEATIEELEASNEEMQATNEELVASNEELQSTNEELQSVNEELFTVNAEFQRKIEQLTEMGHDMENLLSAMEVGTVFLDSRLTIRKFTPLAGKIFSLMAQDIGRSIEDFRQRIDHPALFDDVRVVLESGTSTERQVRDESGQWYLLRILPYLADDSVEGVVVTLIDVDALKEAEEQAREAVVRRDEFLAMLSHELRNPLAAVVNAVELANVGDESTEQALGVIERQSRHMAGILEDLLDVSRVTRNKLTMEKAPLDLRTVVAGAVEAVQPRLDEAGIALEVDVEDEPMPLEGDSLRLRQALANLLDNAIKFNERGGHVWLVCHVESSAYVLRVRDDGIGMREEVIDSLFEPFVQSTRATNGSNGANGGMGVGLALVRAIVQRHGGSVRAHSSGPGRGSEFVVRLRPSAQTAASEPVSMSAPSEAERRKVLLVEDDADNREMLSMLLEHCGYDVATASDGGQALEKVSEFRPAAAVVDIGLPDIDGHEVARRLRSRGEAFPLVALSGFGRPNDKKASATAGFDEHLVKPVALDDLRRTLATVLKRSTPPGDSG